MRGKKYWISVMAVSVGLAFTAACSKNLMPPPVETGSVAESELEEVAQANEGAGQGFAPESDFPVDGSGDESGFMAQENLADAGSIREESLNELGMPNGSSDSSGGTGDYSNPFASNGSSGSFGADGSGMGGDQGMQEARLYSFRPTSELKDIHFQFDKYDLDERSKGVLKQNADFLKQHPSVKVEIQGHCDERGTNNYNLALGQRRADSTKRYLASLGIPESRLHVISYGEEKPFCGETGESCWWRNRRAHFMVAE